jgi:hypothetical protein
MQTCKPGSEGGGWKRAVCRRHLAGRLPYRKEDTEDGHSRQIRFADRVGGDRPDDELLAPVRDEKPMVRFSPREKAWGENKTPDTLEALDRADQTLAEIGRKRKGGHER